MAPVLGEELYYRLSHPPVMSRVDAPIGMPAMRLASRIAARLAGPYGAASGGRSESLATNIVSRLGPPSPVGPAFDAAPGPAPLPLILRRAAPRTGGAPEQGAEQPLAVPQWPLFNRRPVAAEIGLPRAIANESEEPRWRALPDESQADYVASNLPDLALPSLAETLGLAPPSFNFASTLPPTFIAPEPQIEAAPPVELIEPTVVAEQPTPPIRTQPVAVVVPSAPPPTPYVQPVVASTPVPATPPPVAVPQSVPAPVGPLAVLRQALTRVVPDALGRLIGRNTPPAPTPDESAAPPLIATTAAPPVANVADAAPAIEPAVAALGAPPPNVPIDTAPIYAASSSREQIEPFAPADEEPNLPLFRRIARALRLPAPPADEPTRPALTLRRPTTSTAQNVPPILEPQAEEVRRSAAPAPALGRTTPPARVVPSTVVSPAVPTSAVQPPLTSGEAPGRMAQLPLTVEEAPTRIVQPPRTVGEAPTSVVQPLPGVGEVPARLVQPDSEVEPTFDAPAVVPQLPATLTADNTPQPQAPIYVAADAVLASEQIPVVPVAQPVAAITTAPTSTQVAALGTSTPSVQPTDSPQQVVEPNYVASEASDTPLYVPGATTTENYALSVTETAEINAPSMAEPAFTASAALVPSEPASDYAVVAEAANDSAPLPFVPRDSTPLPYVPGEPETRPSRFAGVPLFEAVARFFRPAAENEEQAPLARPLRRRGGRNPEPLAPEEIISASGLSTAPVRPNQAAPGTVIAAPPLSSAEQPRPAGTVAATTSGDTTVTPAVPASAVPAIPTSSAPPATNVMDAPVNPVTVAGSSTVLGAATADSSITATPLTAVEAQRVASPPALVGSPPVPPVVAATTASEPASGVPSAGATRETAAASSPDKEVVAPSAVAREAVAASSVAREGSTALSVDSDSEDEPFTSTVEGRPSRFAGLPLYQAITRFFSRSADTTPAAERPPLVWRTGPARPAVGQESAQPIEEVPVNITASRMPVRPETFRAAEVAATTPDMASIVELAADQLPMLEAQLAAEGITLPASVSVPAVTSSLATSTDAPTVSPGVVGGVDPVADLTAASPVAPNEYGSITATTPDTIFESAPFFGSADAEVGLDAALFGASAERQPNVLEFVRRMAAPLVRLRSLPVADLGTASAEQAVPIGGTDRAATLPLRTLASFLSRSPAARAAGTADGPGSFGFGTGAVRSGAGSTAPGAAAGAASYSALPALGVAALNSPLVARAGASSGPGFAGTAAAAGSGIGATGLAGLGSPMPAGATGNASSISVQRQAAGTSPVAPVGPLWRTLTYLRQQGRVTPAEYQEYVAAASGSSAAPLMFRPERWAALWAAEGTAPFTEQSEGAGAELPFFANAPIYGDEPLPLAPLGHNPAAAPEALASDGFAGFDFGFDSGFAAPVQNFAGAPTRGAAAPVQRMEAGAAATSPRGDDDGEWAGVIGRAVADSSDGSSLDLALAPAERGALPLGTMSAPEPATPEAAGPDLDQLADEVYGMIRRRLVVERERSWT